MIDDKDGVQWTDVGSTNEEMNSQNFVTVKDSHTDGPRKFGKRIYPWLHDVFIFWTSFIILGSLLFGFFVLVSSIPIWIVLYPISGYRSFADGQFISALVERLTRVLDFKYALYLIVIALIATGYSGVIRIIDHFKGK